MIRLKKLAWRSKSSSTPSASTRILSATNLQIPPAQPRPSFHLSRSTRPTTSNNTPSRLFSTSSIAQANFPFKLHDIGEGIAEVELVKWFVEVGQRVEEFDTLCEVQSDKSTVELTSPTVGIVKRLGAEEGVVVKVGEIICDIETEGDTGVTVESEGQDTKSESEAVQVEQPASKTQAIESTPSIPIDPPPQFQSQVIDEDESLHLSRDSILDTQNQGAQFSGEAAMLPSPPPRSSQSQDNTGQTAQKREAQPWSELRKIVKASPAIRTLAARMGIELAGVKGSGEGGRVLRDDLLAFDSSTSTSTNTGTGSSDQVGLVDGGDRSSIPTSTRVEFGRTRKVMYRAMGDMGHVPHFGYSHTLNLTPLLPYMKALNPPQVTDKATYQANDIPSSLSRNPFPEGQWEKVTLLSFLIKGLLLAMEEHPIMRSRVKFGDKEGEKWLEVGRDGVVGVAVSDPKFGLLTPSLPPLPPSTPLSSLTSHLTNLRKNASKPTPPANLTISSVGQLGESTGAMPVLPPGGGLAICAVGRAAWATEWRLTGKKVWDMTPEEVRDGGMEAVLRCPVGWSGDHRVLEGAELIAFTETWKKYIEEPWRWIKIDG